MVTRSFRTARRCGAHGLCVPPLGALAHREVNGEEEGEVNGGEEGEVNGGEEVIGRGMVSRTALHWLAIAGIRARL